MERWVRNEMISVGKLSFSVANSNLIQRIRWSINEREKKRYCKAVQLKKKIKRILFTKNWNMFKTWNCGDCCLHVEMFGVLKYCMFAKPLNSLGEAHSKQMLLVIYQPSYPSWSFRPAGQHLPCMTAHATSSKKKKFIYTNIFLK